jgi:hypothetical protein
LGNEIEKNKMDRSCNAYGGVKRRRRGFGGKISVKEPLEKSSHRWEDNIKIDLREVSCGSMDWIELSQDRDRWQAIVIAVLTFGLHKMRGFS